MAGDGSQVRFLSLDRSGSALSAHRGPVLDAWCVPRIAALAASTGGGRGRESERHERSRNASHGSRGALADARSSADAHSTALYSGIRSLVTELIRRRRQSEQLCDTLSRVLEATSDGFVALDSQWRYTYVNAHAGHMFGRDPSIVDRQEHLGRVPGRRRAGVPAGVRARHGRRATASDRSVLPAVRSLVRQSDFPVRWRARDLLPGCHRATHRRRSAARERAALPITVRPQPRRGVFDERRRSLHERERCLRGADRTYDR